MILGGSCRRDNYHTPTKYQEVFMAIRIGIAIACPAVHRAACTNATGSLLWKNVRFRTSPEDQEALWQRSRLGEANITVVREPTCNAWVPLAV